MISIERRLTEAPWLVVAVPAGSLVAAVILSGLILLVTGHDPIATWGRLLDRGFFSEGAMSATLVTATPLLLTGLAAAAAFRMQTWNIGAEGQLYLGAVGASGAGIALADRPAVIIIPAMIVAGIISGAAWAAIPGVLRAYTRTSEIITSLMLNYVAGLVMSYLIFNSHSYWRDLSTFTARVFPQGKYLSPAATWPSLGIAGIAIPLGFLVGIVAAGILWLIYSLTRFGFEARVIGDSRQAAHYAGMRTRRKIVAVMALSGAMAGIGGASEIGDFRHVLDPRGLQQAGFGYAGIVVAALARLNPFAVVVVAVLLGGLSNAGFSLQGATFPAGLVGTLQGLILFCALAGELLVHYRIRFRRGAAASPPATKPAPVGAA
ncbi:MAG TPA: ABC transporter permease [Candidatus Dormibacteraeota bacterium]|nr:ABC transporter permease [Candidatus Dormibacteraeota bacterium]